MDYLRKLQKAEVEDLLWNIPEQKQCTVNVIGGNAQNFRAGMKVAEYLVGNYPIKTVNLVLPDALRSKLPPLDNLVFLSSTESGSLANGEEIVKTLNVADYNLVVGDLSKNTVTMKAVQSACHNSVKPVLVTRDAVDLLAEEQTEQILMNENLVLMGSVAQLQKIFRAVYYPKMLMMSQSLVQVAEAFHKFTLSYPVAVITLHDGQVVTTRDGEVCTVALADTEYSALTFWNGELAAKVAALNLYNPGSFLEATTAALLLR